MPTFAEEGVPGVVVNNWFGIAAPAKTPPDVVAKLSKELAVVAKDPDYAQRLKTGVFPGDLSRSAAIRRRNPRNSEHFGKVIRDAGVVPQ